MMSSFPPVTQRSERSRIKTVVLGMYVLMIVLALIIVSIPSWDLFD